MRANLEGVDISDCVHRDKERAAILNRVLTGNITLGLNSPPILTLDANGANRVVTMPDATTEEARGTRFYVYNSAAGAFTVTIASIAIGQGKAALVWSDGVAWRVLLGA